MIKAIRPVSNLDPTHQVSRNLRGGAGANQNYRVAPSEAKAANATDAAKDSMSDSEYGDALKRASESF